MSITLDNAPKDNAPQIIDSFEAAISQLEQIKVAIYANPELLGVINNERKKRSSIIKDDNTWNEILNYVLLRLAYDQFGATQTNDEENSTSDEKKPTNDEKKTLPSLSVITFPKLLLNGSPYGKQNILGKYISEYFNMKNPRTPSILKKDAENTTGCDLGLIQYIYDYIMENNPQSPVLNLPSEKFIDIAKIIIQCDDLYKFVTTEAFIKWLTSNSNKDKVNKALTFYCFAFLQSDVISQFKNHQK